MFEHGFLDGDEGYHRLAEGDERGDVLRQLATGARSRQATRQPDSTNSNGYHCGGDGARIASTA
jgi:hypothetical protein